MKRPAPAKAATTKAEAGKIEAGLAPSRDKIAAKPAPARSAETVDALLVRELAQVLADTSLTEIEVRRGDLRIRVSRQATAFAAPMAAAHAFAPAAAPAPAAPAPVGRPAATAADPAAHPGVVTSPMVGTAYCRPNPDAKPFVEVGSKVSAGDKVLLIEAMKTFNEVLAHKSGTVAEILVEDGQPVEFGQPMIIIE